MAGNKVQQDSSFLKKSEGNTDDRNRRGLVKRLVQHYGLGYELPTPMLQSRRCRKQRRVTATIVLRIRHTANTDTKCPYKIFTWSTGRLALVGHVFAVVPENITKGKSYVRSSS